MQESELPLINTYPKMKHSIFLIISLVSFFSLHANQMDQLMVESNGSKNDTVTIKTSAICHMCEERIEHDMAFEKGVRSVDLDLETNILTVVYKKGKNTEEGLKVALTEIGYDADEMPADQKAHDRLPDCCQQGTKPH